MRWGKMTGWSGREQWTDGGALHTHWACCHLCQPFWGASKSYTMIVARLEEEKEGETWAQPLYQLLACLLRFLKGKLSEQRLPVQQPLLPYPIRSSPPLFCPIGGLHLSNRLLKAKKNKNSLGIVSACIGLFSIKDSIKIRLDYRRNLLVVLGPCH